jgi:hypothetical protein
MRFYCIACPKKNKKTVDVFKKSCKDRKLDFILIEPKIFDITHFNRNKEGGILYRAATGNLPRQIESHMINLAHFTTLYSKESRVFFRPEDTPLHEYLGIKIPKTINYLPKDRELLKKYTEYIGGFPLIVKTNGLSHGIGVTKVHNLDKLIEISHGDTGASIMRQYIEHDGHARLIVLGDKVIDSIEYVKPDNDFRTNVGEPNVRTKKYPLEIEVEAVKATVGMGLDFAGVDILVGNNGEYYLAEVNFPCFFARAQSTTGVDISGKLIDFLINKHKI